MLTLDEIRSSIRSTGVLQKPWKLKDVLFQRQQLKSFESMEIASR